MNKNNQRVFSIKDRPLKQCQRLLNWFAHIDVRSFDIHVRRYPNKVRSRESWITYHEDIPREKVLELWNWMRYENSNEADIYFRPHGPVAQPVIFLDDLNIESAYRVANSYSAAVIQTSHNNTQVWVRTASSLSLSQRRQAQSELSRLGYSDRGSTSGDHLGRLCGLFSQKRKTWVNAIYFSTPRAYKPPLVAPDFSQDKGRGARVLKSSIASSSEADFRRAIGMYKSGASYEEVRSAICESSKARGKRNPENYAILTAKKSGSILNV